MEDAPAPAALNKTGCSATHWPTQVKAVGSGYWRMIGTTEQLMEKAKAIGQRWLKGIGVTRLLQKACADRTPVSRQRENEVWAMEIIWINQTEKSSGCASSQFDHVNQFQIMGVQDLGGAVLLPALLA